MGKHAVKKLPLLIKYVPDRYKTQRMCDKVVLENGGRLMSIPDHYKGQNMIDKDYYVHSLGFALDCYKSQKMCDKVVSTYPATIQFVPDRFKT